MRPTLVLPVSLEEAAKQFCFESNVQLSSEKWLLLMVFTKRRLLSSFVGITLALVLMQFPAFQNVPHVQATSTHPATSTHLQTSDYVPDCYPCYSFYGSIRSWMLTATSDWFQHKVNWCGIASIRAIQRYDWIYYNGGNPQWDNSQESIYARLNSYVGPFGSGGGPGVKSNISRDFGTDPYSVAYGAWYETPPSTQNEPYYFHNWIYRTSSSEATYDFATDFGVHTDSHNDPITVMIKGGYHSFVIGGVWASSDPSYGGEAISSIDTWDPWLNGSNQPFDHQHWYYNRTQEQVWSLTDWTTLSWQWGQGYNTNNGSDPEPDTADQYYVPPFNYFNVPHHWDTYFVTVEQDYIPTGSVPADFAIDQNGFLAPHN